MVKQWCVRDYSSQIIQTKDYQEVLTLQKCICAKNSDSIFKMEDGDKAKALIQSYSKFMYSARKFIGFGLENTFKGHLVQPLQ